MDQSRRSVLKQGAGLVGTGVTASLAGCSGTGGSVDGGEGAGDDSGSFGGGYTAFFTLTDWTNRVAGDRATFEDPVEVGRLGHGWEPSGTLAADVAATDAFVYLDHPEFAWTQDLASTLEADYDSVAVIDGLSRLEGDLLAWDHGHGDGDPDGSGTTETEDGHGEDGDGEDGHDGGRQTDPHVWVDPVRSAEVVETIAAGLGDADPDNAEAYADNAEAYAAELDEIDAAFAALTERATRDVAVIAGHNSFQYLEDRYGFRLHSPVGVSPQNEPTQTEIADTIEIVDREGIDTILYDRFGSTTLAEAILENSDATEMAAVSPAGGTTREWNEAGYGYLEQMTEINLPAFRRAFGAQ
ncbi:metal ABC transporter solute-binding protein, Zn/Mn family [Halorubrum salinum]|uniref:metal ABC transporter solute-binding protein, Zn/Mn family n=1 Tax=Halorubrum salinum TaxID=767517 RepID=UPI00211272CB|nr:zinc ABC transporter substrate-binding protein [Halorubrum salinum]